MAMENEKEPMQCGNQSHNVEVAQGAIFMEIWAGFRPVGILKKNVTCYYS